VIASEFWFFVSTNVNNSRLLSIEKSIFNQINFSTNVEKYKLGLLPLNNTAIVISNPDFIENEKSRLNNQANLITFTLSKPKKILLRTTVAEVLH
jgi:hypothetical protein